MSVFLGRGLPVVVTGIQTTAFGFLVSAFLLGFRPAPSELPALALTVLITAASCTGFGMALGSIGLRVRDVWVTANIAYFAMLASYAGVGGAAAAGCRVSSRSWPTSCTAHSRDRRRQAVGSGHNVAAAWPDIGGECLVGVAWATAGFLFFRYFERQGRRSGAFDRL